MTDFVPVKSVHMYPILYHTWQSFRAYKIEGEAYAMTGRVRRPRARPQDAVSTGTGRGVF